MQQAFQMLAEQILFHLGPILVLQILVSICQLNGD